MHATEPQQTSLQTSDQDAGQQGPKIGSIRIPRVGHETLASHSIGSDRPWPDQSLNRILATLDRFHISDFSEIECLEILFYLSSGRTDSRQIAETAIEKYGSLGKIFERPGKELRDSLGLDHSMTAQLAVSKLSMKLILANNFEMRKELSSYEALTDYLVLHMRHADQETLRVIYLDTKYKIIKDEERARGTIDAVEIYPKEIARHAVACNAYSVILAHNHLADDSKPSLRDIQATLRTKRALECLDIVLHDHVIVSRDSCFSMKAKNLI